MKYIFLLLVIFANFFLFPVNSFAGAFKLVPVRIYLDPGEKTSTVKITNTGDEKATIQLYVKQWEQDEKGESKYQDTQDMVIFPKIVSIEKADQRLIRLGYQGKVNLEVERTYRLFFEELPIRKPGDKIMKLALRMSIPVFISPKKKSIERSIDKVDLKDGILRIKVKNGGNTHFMVSKIKATGSSSQNQKVFSNEKSGWYVLAGGSKSFDIAIPKTECIKTQAIKIAVEVEKSLIETELRIDRTMCEHK